MVIVNLAVYLVSIALCHQWVPWRVRCQTTVHAHCMVQVGIQLPTGYGTAPSAGNYVALPRQICQHWLIVPDST